MATPAIQTLLSDAQQVLNLNSLSEVRATMAAALANANVGTPLNPNLTTQQLWDEFYLIVRQPESDIESIITNQLMKFLYAPPAPGGVGGNQQVIYNDNGVLAGDSKFLWDPALNKLDIDGSATISGNLTVDTSTLKVDSANNRVGIGTASPLGPFHVVASAAGFSDVGYFENSQAAAANVGPRASLLGVGSVAMATVESGWNGAANTDAYLTIRTRGSGAVTERYRIASDGVATWSNVGGGTGTAMTLNSTGLGVGVTPRAWATGYRALNVGIYTALTDAQGGATYLTNNAYYDTTDSRWEAVTNNRALRYDQDTADGGHKWYSAPSVAANAALVWSTPMVLDANGNLIWSPATTAPTLATNGQLTVNATSNTNLRFSYRGSDGTTRVANITLA